MAKKINSRAKGCRGELELAKYLQGYGFDARRGQQFKGGSDSPDVVSNDLDALGFQIECKRVEAGNLYNWLEQAKTDTGTAKTPVVMHRRSDKPWVAILDLGDFLNLLLQLQWKGSNDGEQGNK